jgi:hypothetical protein
MKLPLLLLLLFTENCQTAPYAPAQVRVRVMTFADAGVDMALHAVRPGCDEDLFTSLTKNVAAGEAEIVYDQMLLVRGGQRAKVLAGHNIPWASEHHWDSIAGLMIPGGLEWQNAGPDLEVEATVGAPGAFHFAGRAIDLNLDASHRAMLSTLDWPVSDLRGRTSSLRLPLFSTYRPMAQALTATGMTLLLSVAAEAPNAARKSSETRFHYTFLRAGLNGERPKQAASPPPAPSFQRRLHAFALRLPTDEAAALLGRRGDDASLFAGLSARAAAGSAGVSGHASIMGRNGQRSRIDSFVDFPAPTNFTNMIPDSWTYQRLGTIMECDAGGEFSENDAPVRGDWDVSVEFSGPPELTKFHPDRNRPDLHVSGVEYTSHHFTGRIAVPPSGVLCGGIISSGPATQNDGAAGGMTEVIFFLQSPPPAPSASPVRPHQWVDAVLLSLPADSGPAAVVGGDGSELLERIGTAGIYCAGCAAVAAGDDHQSQFQWVRSVPHPAGFHKVGDSSALDLPSTWESAACGLKLEASFVPKSGPNSINATLTWDTAPVLGLGEPGAKVPEMAQRRCEGKIQLKNFPLTHGKAIIADVRPSNAREGTPEHGRWHVLVIRTFP